MHVFKYLQSYSVRTTMSIAGYESNVLCIFTVNHQAGVVVIIVSYSMVVVYVRDQGGLEFSAQQC